MSETIGQRCSHLEWTKSLVASPTISWILQECMTLGKAAMKHYKKEQTITMAPTDRNGVETHYLIYEAKHLATKRWRERDNTNWLLVDKWLGAIQREEVIQMTRERLHTKRMGFFLQRSRCTPASEVQNFTYKFARDICSPPSPCENLEMEKIFSLKPTRP